MDGCHHLERAEGIAHNGAEKGLGGQWDPTAVRLRSKPEIGFWYAIGLAQLDRLDDAVSVFDEVVDGWPEFLEMLDRVAVVDPTAERLRRARAQ